MSVRYLDGRSAAQAISHYHGKLSINNVNLDVVWDYDNKSNTSASSSSASNASKLTYKEVEELFQKDFQPYGPIYYKKLLIRHQPQLGKTRQTIRWQSRINQTRCYLSVGDKQTV